MKKIYTFVLALLSLTNVFAQSGSHTDDTDENLLRAAVRGWHVRVGAGFNLGGTSPLPLPAEIRSIDGFNPGLCIALEEQCKNNLAHLHGVFSWEYALKQKV